MAVRLPARFFNLGWGSATFNPTTLALNAATAALTFANSIDLNPAAVAATTPTRTIGVCNSSLTVDAVTFTGNLAGTGADALVTSTGGTATLTFGGDATTQVYEGRVNDGASATGVVSMVKTGGGRTTLAGTSNYSGPTTVRAGTLRVTGSIANSTVTVQAGATLGGSGTVGPLILDGFLAPGNSPGQLNVVGNASWDSGSTYVWEINDCSGMPGQDPGWDLLHVSGALDIAATSSDRMTIDITGLNPANTSGSAAATSSCWTTGCPSRAPWCSSRSVQPSPCAAGPGSARAGQAWTPTRPPVGVSPSGPVEIVGFRGLLTAARSALQNSSARFTVMSGSSTMSSSIPSTGLMRCRVRARGLHWRCRFGSPERDRVPRDLSAAESGATLIIDL